jgi:hypothetical protein
MCECIRNDVILSSNANNNYSEKVVPQFSSLNDKHSFCSSKQESIQSHQELRNESKTCEKCISSTLSSIVVTETEPKCKGIVVSIDSIESPTIDAVLDKVPLVYDPITKQLLLQSTFNNHNKSTNGLKNGFHPQNGLKKNGLLNLKSDNYSQESDFKLKASNDLLNFENDNNCRVDTILAFDKNDNTFDDKLKVFSNDNQFVDCEQSAHNLLNRKESHSNDNELSVFDSIKGQSLGDEDDFKLCTNQDNISNDESVSSLNLDDCEFVGGSVDSKPKKLFTLSLQSFLSKVKRNTNTNTNSSNRTVNTCNKNGIINSVNITSTTALILENRPPNLPAKPEEEDKKHKLEYEEMIKQARKKKLKELKITKKLIQKQHKQEEQVIEAIKQWTNDILPNWDKCKSNKKTRDLWWSGIPSLVRQKVWFLAINNELNITPELYQICVNRSKEKVWTKNNAISDCDNSDDDYNVETAADLIKLDVSRTFPQLGLFQESGPYHEMLSEVLGAYVTYRPDIGYSQGMSFLAAMLLLNMESAQAFICFANLLNNQLLLSFFRVNQTVMNAYYQTYEELFKENLPKLYKHFNENNLTPDLYLVDYIYTLFSRSLPLDVASRVWDLFLRDGDEFIFRAALGILAMYCDVLLDLDFIYLAQFLTKLPDDIDSDKLFSFISSIRMTIANEKISFSSILSSKLCNSKT